MYLYFGSDSFSLEILKGLCKVLPPLAVVTQPDRPAGRKQQLRPGPLAIFAQENDLALVQPENLKEKVHQDNVLAFGAELMIVVSFGQILPSSFLQRAPTIINGHASLLPALRGASPIQSCILNGDPETGMTIMHIVKALDAGPMISKKSVAIQADDNHASLSTKLIQAGIELLTPYLQGQEVPRGEEQDHTSSTYCHKLSKEDCTLDLNVHEGQQLDRIIRAFSPAPGAFLRLQTNKGEKQFKILKAKMVEACGLNQGLYKKDKDILLVSKDGITLQCSEVQLEGKPALKADVFLNGFRDDFVLV